MGLSIKSITGRGFFTKMFEPLFIDMGSKPLKSEIGPFDSLLSRYVKRFYKHYLNKVDPNTTLSNDSFVDVEDKKIIDIPYNNKILIALTGGKDSVATVLLAMLAGYDVTLYHLRGINRSYRHEEAHAKYFAELFNLPIIFHDITWSGKCDFLENPTKNQYILANMVDLGVSLGIHTFCQGNKSDEVAETQPIDSSYSDSLEAYTDLNKFYKSYIPNYKYVCFIPNDAQSYIVNTLFDSLAFKGDILKNISSCMMPVRYKGSLRKHNIEKYGIEPMILEGRCGSCLKCGLEYMYINLLYKMFPSLVVEGMVQVKKTKEFTEHVMDIAYKQYNKLHGKTSMKETLEYMMKDIGEVTDLSKNYKDRNPIEMLKEFRVDSISKMIKRYEVRNLEVPQELRDRLEHGVKIGNILV